MYNTYEEYMQSVLGYNMNNTYNLNESSINAYMNKNSMQSLNKLYPEIYGIVYPLIQKICSKKRGIVLTEDELKQMVDEIYNVMESKEENEAEETNRRNGDVRNPRAREVARENSPRNNHVLRDLIQILILREFLEDNMTYQNMQMPQRVPPILRPRLLSLN